MDPARSTFPLDEAAITRAALGKVLTDPITWVPLVPVVAAYTLFDVSGGIVLMLAGGVLTGLGAFWRQHWESLTGGLRRNIIADHNRAQNALLQTDAMELRKGGAADYAAQLEQFVAAKIQIERRLHEDGAITAQKSQIEQLVDSLCFGVRDQLMTLARQEKKHQSIDPEATLRQVSTAFDTLQSTLGELDLILGPSEPSGDGARASLEEVTRRLREEAEIARRVQARLRPQESADVAATPRLENE